MSRNTLVFIVGGLVVIVAVVGYLLYQEKHQAGFKVEVGKKGISVQTN